MDIAGNVVAISTKPYAVNAVGDSNGSVYLFEQQFLEGASGSSWEFQRRMTQDTSLSSVTFGQQVDLTPERLFRRSSEINSLNFNSFREIREGDGSIIFSGRTAWNPETPEISPSAAVIVFDTECTSSRPLEPMKWTTISPPCLSANNPLTVSDVFSDDFGDAVYLSEWIMYAFDLPTYDYKLMALTDELVPGAGYWLLNATGQTVVLDLPTGTAPDPVNLSNDDIACVDTARGCLSETLPDFPEPRDGFRMIGNPFNSVVPIADIRIRSADGACVNACDLDEANDAELVFHTMYRYRGEGPYDFLTTGDQLLPWDGAFLATYLDAAGVDTEIVFPLSSEE